MKTMQLITVAVLSVALLAVGCATMDEPAEEALGPYYVGIGTGDSLGPALSAAKVDAMRAAVIELIGPEAERAQRERLDDALYGTSTPNRYVDNESMEIMRRENRGTTEKMDLLVEIRVRVDVREIERILATHDITSTPPGQATAGDGADDADGGSSAGNGNTAGRGSSGDLGNRALDTMTMLVTGEPEAQVAREYLAPVITQANRYLLEAGYTVVDQDQVQELLRDRELAYEEATGERASVLQWVAQRLNADVYVVADVTTHGEIDGRDYYGNATINLTMYETSTGQLLGSVSRRSQRTFSRASLDDAVINAVQSATYAAMEKVESQVREQMARSLSRGIRYEVTIQSSVDARMMSDFRSELRDQVSELVTEAQTAEETVYSIYFRGSIEELEEVVYQVSRDVAGMQDMYHVLTRGRNLVFNTGL
ncbi:MAG: DUF6175 family protein [Spirochaetota bacterium]